jgi:hypothetical protein
VVGKLGPERQAGDRREEKRGNDTEVEQRDGSRTCHCLDNDVPPKQQCSEDDCPEQRHRRVH